MRAFEIWIIGFALILLLSEIPAAGDSVFAKGFGASACTDIGIRPDLGSLYEKVNSTGTYKVEEKDGEHLRWSLGGAGTADSAIVFSDGRVQIGGQSDFSPPIKSALDREMKSVMQLLNTTVRIPDASRRLALSSIQYYSGDDPVDATSWRIYGDQIFNKGDYSESLVYYNKSLEEDQSNADAWNNKGAALACKGRYNDAVLCYDRAINDSQNSSVPWNNKGLALFKLRRVDEALECLNQSCNMDPGNAIAWYDKGVLLSGLRRYQEALLCYNRSIAGACYYPQAWNNKGLALAMMGDLNDSISCLRNAATLDQKYAVPWVNAGIALKAIGLNTNAEEAFGQAERLGYKHVKTADYQWAGVGPWELISIKKQTAPGLGIETAAFAILIVFLLVWRRKL